MCLTTQQTYVSDLYELREEFFKTTELHGVLKAEFPWGKKEKFFHVIHRVRCLSA